MKNILFAVLTISLFFSCKKEQKEVQTSGNEALVKQYFEHFNAHDFTKMAEMYTDTAAFKDPSLGLGIVNQTKAETIKKYTELNKIFPDLRDSLVNIYPSQKNIIVEFVSRGTGPDQSKFELPICTIFTFENGKITQDFTYYDNFED